MENQAQGQTRPQIKVSEVLTLLKQGKSRKEIKEHYGLNATESKMLFNQEGLKRKRVMRGETGLRFDIVNDVATVATPAKPATAPAAQVDGSGVANTTATSEAQGDEQSEAASTAANQW